MDTKGIFTKETRERLWNALTEDEKQKLGESYRDFLNSDSFYSVKESLLADIYQEIFGANNISKAMIAEMEKPKERNPKFLICDVGPRFMEDALVNGVEDSNSDPIMPLTYKDGHGDYRWKIAINLESGRINDWPEGTTAHIWYKVCDDGIYTFVDENFSELKTIDGYVPDFLAIYDAGFGDYIHIDIDENGYIQDWKFTKKDYEEMR